LRLTPWAVLFLELVGGLLLAPTQGRAETIKPPRASALTYEKDIRPILKANCFDCHGEREKPKAGLDLRLRRLIVAGGESGPAIVPGKPKDSRLIDLVRRGEMPKREKKLSPAEVQLLERWVAAGAKTARPEPEQLPPGMSITEEERQHWAFQPIRRPEIPPHRPKDRVRTPVDAFLVAAMKPRGLNFSPDADRITLLRRAWLDLAGLPPSPEAVERFLADSAPDAYERMIDELLNSPRYGERWGRHWLDIAGYADSDGATTEDTPRAYAYKYRDYVIRAFNADKPFDRFLQEQLAGDELARVKDGDGQNAVRDPASLDLLLATGFLRMGPDGTAGGAVDQDLARNQVVADTIKIVSTSLLGLSVGCAQCHDHRYDPIPQADYYRLRAVFEPAYDWKHWRNPNQRLISLYTEADRQQAAAVEEEAKKLSEERGKKEKTYLDAALEKELEKFEPPLRGLLEEACHAPADKRTPEQAKLLKENPSVNITSGVLYQYNQKAADDLKAMDAKIAEVRGRRPPEDFISPLTEVAGQVPVTHLFHRGDPQQPGEAFGPAALSVLGADGRPQAFAEKDPALATSGRRLAFARWLTGESNPLTPRVLVNRVWMHHFGRGLVRTPGDFGAMGEKPTHPELLDWLAGEFVARGWSVKELHRLILTSTAYRQSSARTGAHSSAIAQAKDPENMYYWHKPVQRLDAEVLRDSMLAVSGALDRKMFGTPVPVRPDVTGQIVVGVDKTEGDNKMPVDVPLHGEEFRRSVYVQVRRSRPLAMLAAFDAPAMELNCERRPSSTVAPQALLLMNSQFTLDQAARFADRVRHEAGTNAIPAIDRAWRLAFGRAPSAIEAQESRAFLDRQVEFLGRTDSAAGQKPDAAPEAASSAKTSPPKKSGTPTPPVASDLQALRDLCQALFSANEFLYVE
jgi:mono/diheme cytochrome c family protein